MRRKHKLTLVVARPFLGAVLGLFVLVFGAIWSVAAVDHAVHHDAGSHPGGCAICSFAKSQVETTDGLVTVCQPAMPADEAAIPTAGFPPPSPSYLLPLGRAPPILSVVS